VHEQVDPQIDGPARHPSVREPDLSKDEVFSTLSNARRRYVLEYLQRTGGRTQMRDLTEAVAAHENGCTREELNYRQRKRVYTSLHQTHLPKMHDLGIVVHDPNRGTIAVTEAAAEFDLFLEVVPEGEIRWSELYLGLAGVGTALVVVAFFDLFPFSLVPDLGYAAAVVVAFALTAVAHTVDTNRHRFSFGAVDGVGADDGRTDDESDSA
jgi:hypothetical protein